MAAAACLIVASVILRLDRHVGAHRGVGVAIETDDVIGAGVEADHKARLGVLDDLTPVAELVLVVGENVEADARLRQSHAAYEHGRELEPSSIEDEGFLQRPAALDLDLPGEVGEAIGCVHEIFAWRQCRRRHPSRCMLTSLRAPSVPGRGVNTLQISPVLSWGPASVRSALKGHGHRRG